MGKRRVARGSLVAEQKEGGRLHYPERATYLLLSPERFPLMNIATNGRESATTREMWRATPRTDEERKQDTAMRRTDGEGGVSDPREQNLSENSTIDTATGSAFVRRGTIDENAPQNS